MCQLKMYSLTSVSRNDMHVQWGRSTIIIMYAMTDNILLLGQTLIVDNTLSYIFSIIHNPSRTACKYPSKHIH